MRTLLYLIYGTERRYHLELTYSVLSAARFLKDDPSGVRIVLVADEMNRRPDLPVEHVVLAPDLLHEWQMDGTYRHAAKIHALHHALETRGAPTVLIDSDTILKHHPGELFGRIAPGRTLMHDREGRLRDRQDWPQWKTLVDASGERAGGFPLTGDTVMYNSGVLGVHPDDIGMLDRVREVMVAIREHSDIFTAEQLAAAIVLAAESEVSTCQDLVEHYWGGPREYYHYQIDRMFPEVLEGGGISGPPTPLPALSGMPKGRFLPRLAARAKRLQRRATPEYGHAYMAYLSALALRRRDAELANVWAAEAVGMLAWGLDERPAAATGDFVLLTPERLAAHDWLRPDVKHRWMQYWNGEIGPATS